MNSRKIIKRTLLGIVLIFILIISSGIIFSIIYKEKIIGYFISEANKHITTPIDVGKIEISSFNHFPNVSINLHDVTIKESSNDHQGVLGKAKKISLSFNPLDIIHKNYTINGIHLTEVDVTLVIDENGNPNYLFYKKDSTSKGSMVALKNITGEKLNIDYLDKKSNYHVALHVKKANAHLAQINNLLKISVNGSLVSDEIRVAKRVFFNNKEIDVDTDFELDMKDRIYTFNAGNLTIDKGKFEVTGKLDVAEKKIDLDIEGVNTNFQSINSLLSNDLSKYFKDYNSTGQVYFSGSVNGSYKDKVNPLVKLKFGAKNASFFHPGYKKQIKGVSLTGNFNTGKVNKRSNYRLDIQNFTCKLEDKQIEGSLALKNFDDIHMDLILKGEADVNTLLLLFPKDYVKAAYGNIKMDIHINGKVNDPKLTKSLDANGEVELKNVSFVLNGEKLPFNKLNGSFMLRNNDLAINDFMGFVGNSDFRLNGFIKDISKILFVENRIYNMQADLKADYLDFDELLKSNFASRDTTSKKTKTYEFNISPQLSLDFNCEISNLKFQRFEGRAVKGQIVINKQNAILNNMSFSSMGGNATISGSINSKSKDIVETISEVSLNHIDIDSIFYVFKNFNQDWLKDENLRGQIDATINLYMNFNKNLILNSNSLVADIQTSIENGELKNFEPMKQLSKFVEEESLANTRFSRMTNEIKIKNRTIYLPEMEINSNVSNILISGTHTFDKEIDYHLSVPLKSFIRISKKKNYIQSARHGMNLLLKITGTTSDYSISYDSKALKDSFRRDFTDERQEWKSIKNKEPVAQEEIPELEEEFFDFEESDSIN